MNLATLTFTNLDTQALSISKMTYQQAEIQMKAVEAACKETDTSSFVYIVLRVDTWKNLARDLFLPSFVHIAMRMNDMASMIFVSFFAIIFDLATLTARLVTLPFVYSAKLTSHKNHPLTKWLENESDDIRYADRLRIRIEDPLNKELEKKEAEYKEAKYKEAQKKEVEIKVARNNPKLEFVVSTGKLHKIENDGKKTIWD